MAEFAPVISDRYPYLDVLVTIRGWHERISALIDTGFTGNLVLPSSLLSPEIGLPDGRIEWQLADESLVTAPLYLGDIEILGIPVISASSVTFLGSDFIVGRGIVDRFKVTLDHGERVIVEP
ncbi:MAG: hypothetical protein J4N94_06205 [Chloroflexi bacterium]|nr:hypothetical protein [Chloroflexota bacterium]MCI0771456.1 hypothetical protein [Chloroflexota bacterium]